MRWPLWRRKRNEGFDLVSVMVRLHAESAAEKILIPAFVFFFFQLYPPAWVDSAETNGGGGGRRDADPARCARKAGGIERHP